MRRPVARIAIIILIVLALLLAGFAAGVAVARGPMPSGSADAVPTFAVFWQAWDIVQQHYVDRSALDPTTMTYGAIQGMVNALGDVGHSRFLSPQALREEEETLAGRLEGIGAELVVRDGRPTILAPIPGAPAQQAGLRPGDTIVRIDGKDVAGLSLEQVVRLVRGPAGTQVTITILHRGDTALTDITITRAKITVPNVTWARVPGTPVAHILVGQFGERATSEVVAAIKAARAGGATAIVLDLRNNPGGIRDEAIGVASQFIGEGNVLLEQDADGKRTEYPVRPGGVALDMPLAVLINEGSASSSEIVAGAIQDHRRASLVGANTFGTGTVLTPFRLSDGSAILLGTEQWLTPNGHQIWHQGITPDVRVTLPNGALPVLPQEEASLTPEQFQTRQDTQLQNAVELVAQPVPAR